MTETDIVKRLRSGATVFYEFAADDGELLKAAADEIARLRERERILEQRIFKRDIEIGQLWRHGTND